MACGCSQVSSLNFHDSFVLVVNDVKFHTLLAAMILLNLKAKIINVENAFLHSKMKEEIFMEIPEGMDAPKEKMFVLN
jgi:hypothetical protein